MPTLDYLKLHLNAHPKAEIRDAVKFLFQACLGPGHLVTDPLVTLYALIGEAEALPPERTAPYFEQLSRDYARLDLAALQSISIDTLHTMFLQSTPETAHQDTAELSALLDAFVADDRFFPDFSEEKAKFVAQYKEESFPLVRHSAAYRAAYAPAYRVVNTNYMRCFKLIERISQLEDALYEPGNEKRRLVVAIDGPCASGKTTLAALLATVFRCDVIHMDDFFLPPALRTPERFDEPGGNVHYERFASEVVAHLQDEAPFAYRVFDCKTMQYTGMRTAGEKDIIFVEGSYAQHPAFGDAYDLKIFVKTPYAEQCARIEARNGMKMLARFEHEWIPLENTYFDAFDIETSSDMTVET